MKWHSSIKTVVGSKITVLLKKKPFWYKFVQIVNASEISIGIYEIHDVWNEYNIETVPKKPGKYLSSLLTSGKIKMWCTQYRLMKKGQLPT